MGKKDAGALTSPIKDIEEQGYYSFLEWPVFLVWRMSELKPQLKVLGIGVDNETPNVGESSSLFAGMHTAEVATPQISASQLLANVPSATSVAASPAPTTEKKPVGKDEATSSSTAKPGWRRGGTNGANKAVAAGTGQEQMVPLKLIKTDGGTQIRVGGTKEAVVKEYALHMREKAKLPAVILYFDGKIYWLADGFHRVAAALLNRDEAILSEVREGGKREAILHSITANRDHAFQYSNEDKRNSIRILLLDPECVAWTDNRIAIFTGTDHKTVAKVRAEMVTAGTLRSPKAEKPATRFKVGS